MFRSNSSERCGNEIGDGHVTSGIIAVCGHTFGQPSPPLILMHHSQTHGGWPLIVYRKEDGQQWTRAGKIWGDKVSYYPKRLPDGCSIISINHHHYWDILFVWNYRRKSKCSYNHFLFEIYCRLFEFIIAYLIEIIVIFPWDYFLINCPFETCLYN